MKTIKKGLSNKLLIIVTLHILIINTARGINMTNFQKFKDYEEYIFTNVPEIQKAEIFKVSYTKVKKKPLIAIRISTNKKSPLRVMITARIHGNEQSGMIALCKLLDRFKRENLNLKKPFSDFEFLIIPCLNPEGTIAAIKTQKNCSGFVGKVGRRNAQDLDLNRDYEKLESKETQFAVSCYNLFKPHIVLDLHEFSTFPLFSTTYGFWRAECFDMLVSTGKVPQVREEFRKFCLSLLDEVLKTLNNNGIRSEQYMLSKGMIGTEPFNVATASSYFLLRGAATYLIETAGSDLGFNENVEKRAKNHIKAITLFLKTFSKNKDKFLKIYQKNVNSLVKISKFPLKVLHKPSKIKLHGKYKNSYKIQKIVEINHIPFLVSLKGRFKGPEFSVQKWLKIPSYFIIKHPLKKFLTKLKLHNIKYAKPSSLFIKKFPRFKLNKNDIIINTFQKERLLIMTLFHPELYKKKIYAIEGFDKIIVIP